MNIVNENNVIFEPIKLAPDYEFNLPEHLEEVLIAVEPGINLNGIFFDNPASESLLIYFQGNAKNLQNWLDNHNMSMEWNHSILVVDYRGFGKSDGVLGGQSQMYSDAEKIYEYAKSLGYDDDQISFYGYSMGSAMATYLASKVKAKALVLESAYSSIAEIGIFGDKAPSYKLDNKEIVKSVNIPTLVIHGDLDDIITPDHAHRIYNNLSTRDKELIMLAGGGHGDLRSRPEYKEIITGFFNRI
ncbi:hypothetical protein CLV51_1105 [Chitinophaga niastensis]|uniref:Serine aminopeptidase S33 domain-containing protein n=1 Tax=Chitinophaga niastensis TaxID=536980 RepID=A0A2P8H9E4_CHINA|nr:alpha/beta fold hydrolase [Chitinophaga niastensis]PSL42789.1 hypothetical protein CLV51_1105 [Chitinophaga niastensis]